MTGYRLAPQAADDVLAIYLQGFDLFGLRQADAYQDELERAFQRLAEFPELGRARDGLTSEIRTLPTGSHVIIYEIQPPAVIILRIRHGREDWTGDPMGYT